MSQFDDYINGLTSAILSGNVATDLKCEALSLEHGNPNNTLSLPLVLIGVSSLDQDDERDVSDGIVFDASMEAHCILPSEHANDVHAMKFALTVLSVIHRNSLGLDFVSNPEEIRILPGDFTSVNNGYESRVVQWQQQITLNIADHSALLSPFEEAEGVHTLSGTTEPTHTDLVILDQ